MEGTRYERREKHTGKEVTDPAHGQLEQASRQKARLRQKERERRPPQHRMMAATMIKRMPLCRRYQSHQKRRTMRQYSVSRAI